MNYLFRTERAAEIVVRDRQFFITEEFRGRWRPVQGDILLLTEGSNLNMAFRYFLEVQEAAIQPIELNQQQTVRLKIRAVLIAEGEALLSQMMYSLSRISNFTRPGLNLRHHTQIIDSDYQRVRTGDAHLARSIYFGLLQFLPARWRTYLDLAARGEHARSLLNAKSAADLQLNIEDRRWPVRSLVDILQQQVLPVVTISAQAAERRKGLPSELRGPFAEVSLDGLTLDSWPESILRWSEQHYTQMLSLQDEVIRASQEQVQESEGEWRPHHW